MEASERRTASRAGAGACCAGSSRTTWELRAAREQRVEVRSASGAVHGSVEAGHTRALATVFGTVSVEPMAYRHRRAANLHPADGGLNLPAERHSHGLRRLAADESLRGPFEEVPEACKRKVKVAVVVDLIHVLEYL